jgi:tetratricopeptide (TPR) repeat protein
MRRYGQVLLTVLLTGSFFPGFVAAQDMTFDEEETGQAAPTPPPPPAEGPPSEALANALRLYESEHYDQAAIEFQRVVDGETGDQPANVQQAQFALAKCMYHLGFYQTALAIFDEITQLGTGHLYFDQTLEWLAQLASQLPEPANIIERVGRFGVEQLERFNTNENRELYNQLVFMMGRHQYNQGEFDAAVDLFQRVSESSRFYVEARFFEGITHVRRRQARPAIAAFRAIKAAIDEGDAEVQDEDRMRNLAWLSLARVYYTAANRRNEETGDVDVDGTLLGQAVEAWTRVDQGSEYWLDALFESSWAFFLADEYSRALGNIHTIFSPYFQDSYYPEALVLKAVTFFVNCQTDNALATVGLFHERFDPVRDELETTLAQFQDNVQFFEFLKAVREGNADLSPRIRGLVTTAMSDRTLLRNLEYVRLLEEEEGRLQARSQEFQDSPVGARVFQEVALAKSFAIDQAGDLARGRYNRLIDELMDLSNQVDTVELEIATYLRGQLGQEVQEQMTVARESGGGRVEVDEEHQLWPFDGEYWRDELGFYRQQVTNQCGR